MKIEQLAKAIIKKKAEVPMERSMLIGISGIDASGKGFVTNKLANSLTAFNVAIINVDGWLNLPYVRFSDADHGSHFYENALRLDELFERLILPLKQNRSINIVADFAEETADKFRAHNYKFDGIDIILLEGIFLFKLSYVGHFDLKIWIDCNQDTALQRAILRSQEGLSPDETTRAYETIYFPAQQLHFERDNPRSTADLIVSNEN